MSLSLDLKPCTKKQCYVETVRLLRRLTNTQVILCYCFWQLTLGNIARSTSENPKSSKNALILAPFHEMYCYGQILHIEIDYLIVQIESLEKSVSTIHLSVVAWLYLSRDQPLGWIQVHFIYVDSHILLQSKFLKNNL